MSTLQSVLMDTQFKGDLKLMVIGRSGRGKSTLLNSIIERGKEVMREGAGRDAVTEQVNVYTHEGHMGTITLVDSPGLQV